MQWLRPHWALESNTFTKRFRPAHLPTDALRGVAKLARTALLASVRGSGDKDLDVAVYEETRKELDKGFLSGPIDPNVLPEGATLTRRFGVKQKEKVRPIDDCRASLVNASVTQAEVVSIHGVHHIPAIFLQTTCAKPVNVEMRLPCGTYCRGLFIAAMF